MILRDLNDCEYRTGALVDPDDANFTPQSMPSFFPLDVGATSLLRRMIEESCAREFCRCLCEEDAIRAEWATAPPYRR